MNDIWKETVSLAAAAGAACMLWSRYEKRHFSVEVIEVISPRLEEGRNLVFLPDLHSNGFDRDSGELAAAIHRLRPGTTSSGRDVVICRGKRDMKVPLKPFRRLAVDYSVYCDNGNRGSRMVWERSLYGDLYEEYRNAMTAMGVRYLKDSFTFLGKDLRVTGPDLSSCFYRKALYQKVSLVPEGYMEWRLGKRLSVCKEGPFVIFLAHSPLCFDSYAHWGAGLILAGHFHGGIIRISGLGGIMTPRY